MEINFFEESAPLTEEQWERIIQYYRWKRGTRGEQFAQALTIAKQFREDMEEIQRSVGHSQEEFGAISQALLDMAKEQGD